MPSCHEVAMQSSDITKVLVDPHTGIVRDRKLCSLITCL